MSTTINWNTATDAQKNACFAREICGENPVQNWHGTTLGHGGPGLPDYLHSADAVLPWLEKDGNEWSHNVVRHFFGEEKETLGRHIEILATKKSGMRHVSIYAPKETPFPEAAMIALLRAKGVEVII